MRGKLLLAFSLLTLLIPAGAMRADEIRLKDGSKIIGTIVGFENDSFRVETSYGFALIQKDKVADISITAAKKDSDQKPKPNAAVPPSPATVPSVIPAVAKEPATPANASAGAIAAGPMRAPVSAGASGSSATKTEIAAPKIKSVAAAEPAPPVAPPAPPPAPVPLVI